MKGDSRVGRRMGGEIPASNQLYDSPRGEGEGGAHARGSAPPSTAQLLSRNSTGHPTQSPNAPRSLSKAVPLLAFLFLKAASPFSLGSRARNLEVIPTFPAPSSAVPNLSARSAVPWKCHSSSPFLLPSPPLKPLFSITLLCPRIFNNSPEPAAPT